jgi:hypothetical protein
MSLATSGAIGCAHGLLKPSLAVACSAAILVGASTVVRSGSPISRAYSRSTGFGQVIGVRAEGEGGVK